MFGTIHCLYTLGVWQLSFYPSSKSLLHCSHVFSVIIAKNLAFVDSSWFMLKIKSMEQLCCQNKDAASYRLTRLQYMSPSGNTLVQNMQGAYETHQIIFACFCKKLFDEQLIALWILLTGLTRCCPSWDIMHKAARERCMWLYILW